MARPRDSMWSRVLNAERDVAAQLQLEVLAVPAVESLLRKIERSTWWAKRRPDTKLRLLSMKKMGVCTQNFLVPLNSTKRSLELKLPAKPTAFDVLHAVAHHLIVDEDGNPNTETAWHGAEFTRAMLDLVRRFVGPSEHDLLKQTYLDRGIRTRTVAKEVKERNKQRWVERDLRALLDELR